MKISDLAKASSTHVETIRFYEREGLLPAPVRSQGNYRIYQPTHLDRLLFIRHCRRLDMSLDEVRVLLRVRDGAADDCGDVNATLDQHIVHVTDRIEELRILERQLRDLRQRCGASTTAEGCGILLGLAQAAHEGASTEREAGCLQPLHRRR